MTNLTKLSNLFLVFWLLFIHSPLTFAADLTFTPTAPIVAVNQQITLTVSGTSGEVTWIPFKGQIQGTGNQVTYIAPGEVALDAVAVKDSANNIGTLKIIVTQSISLNDTNWQVIPTGTLTGTLPPAEISVPGSEEEALRVQANGIQALALSEDGKTLWVGNYNAPGRVGTGGLEQRDSTTGELLSQFYAENGYLPDNTINALLFDGIGGLWIGTKGGLAHLSADQTWQVFNTENSGLPDGAIFSLLRDSSNGLWIGTNTGGLAHYADGQWQVFNTENSSLPDDSIWALAPDGVGGLWIGTKKGGLVHRTVNGEWLVFNTVNSGLPNNWIYTALDDKNGGVWLGTNGGLAHFEANGEWQILNAENSPLPINIVMSLAEDGNGGVWMGTGEGLVHLDSTNGLTSFDPTSAGLPNKGIMALVSDKNGSVWLGVTGGIAHVTPIPTSLCTAAVDATTCQALLTSRRAAIIIAGGGNEDSNTLWETTESISNRLYNTFNKRGFDNDEIYYLSSTSWADFNGDGMDDRIVDAPKPEGPLTVEDVRAALQWAKGRGKLDQPLYLFFTGNEGDNKLQLSKLTYLDASDFKVMLDDYQTATANQVIVVIDAGYSGSFLPSLAAPNRAIISSATADGLAYFDRSEKSGFNRFFADYLVTGASFLEAFQLASHDQNEMLGQFNAALSSASGSTESILQIPQLDDNGDGVFTETDGQWLRQIYLNGNFSVVDESTDTPAVAREFTIQELTPSTTLQAGQPIVLKAQVKLTPGTLKRVWATLEPPTDNLALETKSLELSATSEPNVWETTWKEAFYGGEYKVTFSAEDGQGNVANSNSVTITVNGLAPPQDKAAIIIAGGGSDKENADLWPGTEKAANRIYFMLRKKGFLDKDIYYLSPKMATDYDVDGKDDLVIRTTSPGQPLTVAEVQKAFEWARTLGTLNQPLYLFFIDHGGPDKLQLANLTFFSATDFRKLLDDYQTATSNPVIVMIDACQSGAFLKHLHAPNRAIISSAGIINEDKYEDAFFIELMGFSYFFANHLLSGDNFSAAFIAASEDQQELLGNHGPRTSGGDTNPSTNKSQTPSLDDDGDGVFTKADRQWLSQFYVNETRKVSKAGTTLSVTGPKDDANEPIKAIVHQAGQPLTLKATAGDVAGEAKRVWAIIRPPQVTFTRDQYGSPKLVFPTLELVHTGGELAWEADWNDTVYNGNYEINFYAEDNQGNRASSDAVIITIIGGVELPPQATVQLLMDKPQYRRGETFKATLVEELGWTNDLYAAVVLPDGNFMAIKNTNNLASLNDPQNWDGPRLQHSPRTLLELTLPDNLPTGQYCLYGILSPKGENVFDTLSQGLWVVDSKCFEVF
ncbi:MAG: hypothetical protein BWK78_06220 [Thiotrichaceae bacterium IS1]|nr:MAG: hypothetical protein BWK78_06220 [Thiotrichaceae bacterium IS1]